jgi:carboxypeptidase Q
MLLRMSEKKQSIRVNLFLDSDTQLGSNSSNLVFEIPGTERPKEILLMGGHIDSWDTGSQTGANDDGGGFFTVFEALRLIKQNGLRAKRTLRFIAWSGEEWGGYYNNGARQYFQQHINEINDHIVAFENDLGSTRLKGFGVSNSKNGMALVKQLADRYLSAMNATLVTSDGTAADTSPLYNVGVPVMANEVEDTPDHAFYFTYHHSRGDSMSIMNPDEMDSNVLGIAAMFYLLADL